MRKNLSPLFFSFLVAVLGTACATRGDAEGLDQACPPNSNNPACRTHTPVRTATLAPTMVPTQAVTVTVVPTATTAPETPTAIPETMVPVMTPTPGGQPTPVPGAECPASVHDGYQTIGPDGQSYPTWHPQIDPIFGCFFNHEHGDDPRTSRANSSLPVFGYFDGRTEPHNGYKVHVVNETDRNDEGSPSLDNHRVVAHMGTGGPARFSRQFHSLQYDLIGRDRELHIGGMADTGGVGSICEEPRPGKVVMVTQGCVTQSPYEIWAMVIEFVGVTAHFSPSVFDPATMMDPNNPMLLIRTAEGFNGCKREFYFGPVFWPDSDFGPVTSGLGYIATYKSGDPSQPQSQFKLLRNYCATGVGPTN